MMNEKGKREKVIPDAATIRWCRYEKGWTQEQLAERAGVTKKTVQNLEDGKSVRPVTLRRVAKALDVELTRLLGTPPRSLPKTKIAELLARLDKLERRQEAFELYMRAEELRRLELLDEAEYYYNQVLHALKWLPESELVQHAQIGIAKIQRRRMDPQGAIRTLRQLLANFPAAHHAHYNLACYLNLSGAPKREVLEELGQTLRHSEGRRKFYQQYAAKDPDFQNLYVDPDFRRMTSQDEWRPEQRSGLTE
jgi:transcriptional regulator with XRE-family HTH domain